jgi:TPR repeat protein/tRNA A-37 threonylcarbamoyl transferase component Bud32
MLGQVVGNYRIVNIIGRGGMGVVYLGEHTLIQRRAAIKVLLPELSFNQDMVRRFFNEARAANAIQHPGIVEIIDFGHHGDGSAFIVMEFLQGESLHERLSRAGVLATQDAALLARQVAGALAAAHDAGIVHRDLKPDNIFLVRDPEVPGGERIKLLDFGIAKLTEHTTPEERTRTGAVMGTPTYMAPEQCAGNRDVDARADLYALGCVLYRMVCGRPPFSGMGSGETLAAQLHLPVPPPRTLAATLPPAMEALILRLLEKDPARRHQSARELIADLDRTVSLPPATLPSGVAAGPGERSPTSPLSTLGAAAGARTAAGEPSGQRRAAVIAAAAAVAIIAGGALVYAVTSQGSAGAGNEAEDAGAQPEITPALPPGTVITAAHCKPVLEHLGRIMSAQVGKESAPYLDHARYLDTPSEAKRLVEDCASSYDAEALGCFAAASGDSDVVRCGDALIHRQCQAGDQVGCVSLGWRLYKQGDYQLAAERARAACDNAVASGCTLLGTLHFYGRGAERDLPAALKLYEQAYALGDMDAGNELADMVWRGIGVKKDLPRSRAIYEEICRDMPYHGACAKLGEMKARGLGGEAVAGEAMAHYEATCAADVPRGCVHLGDHKSGEPGSKPAGEAAELYAKARRLYELGADHAPYSEFRLAELILAGKGGRAEPARAAAMFEHACAENEPLACVAAGDVYVSTRVPIALDRARQAYERACKDGLERGCEAVECHELLAEASRSERWIRTIRQCREQGVLPRETRQPTRRPARSRGRSVMDVEY